MQLTLQCTKHGGINQFTRFNDLTHLVGTIVTPVTSREEKRKHKQFQIYLQTLDIR